MSNLHKSNIVPKGELDNWIEQYIHHMAMSKPPTMLEGKAMGIIEALQKKIDSITTNYAIEKVDATALLGQQAVTIIELQERITTYQERLEIAYKWVGSRGISVRVEIPEDERDEFPDGIDCRDDTIAGLEERLESEKRAVEAVCHVSQEKQKEINRLKACIEQKDAKIQFAKDNLNCDRYDDVRTAIGQALALTPDNVEVK